MNLEYVDSLRQKLEELLEGLPAEKQQQVITFVHAIVCGLGELHGEERVAELMENPHMLGADLTTYERELTVLLSVSARRLGLTIEI